MMLLLPAVSKTLADELANIGYDRRESATVLLSDVAKSTPVWLRLVGSEIEWCSRHRDLLTFRHRRQACMLLDWYYAQVGEVPESWYALYDDTELFFRSAVAELNFATRHVDTLNPRRRDSAIDLLEYMYAECPAAYRPSWNVLYYA